MKNQSRRMALCGVMTALGVVFMLMGGVIPLATFCCPALAGLALVPVLVESGGKMAMGSYAAVAVLNLLLSPDKESALLFAFLGYYPVVKPLFDRIHPRPVGLVAKLGLFNLAAGVMLACAAWLLGAEAALGEYEAMGRVGYLVFVALANVTMALYDRLLAVARVIYLKKLRPRLMRGA